MEAGPCVKSAVRGLLAAIFGAEIVGLALRQLRYRIKMRSGYFGLNSIDQKLESLLPHRNGFYVELGANDGAFQSNSYFFELKKGWTGVLVEPAPNLYLSCLKRRSPQNHIAAVACTPFGFSEKYVALSYANAMTLSRDLELDIADSEEHLRLAEQWLPPREATFEFGARAATLNSVLEDANAPSDIDFLSLDVEGAELAVLQGVDFEKYKFKYIVVESRDVRKVERFLEPKGYRLLEVLSQHDFLFEGSK